MEHIRPKIAEHPASTETPSRNYNCPKVPQKTDFPRRFPHYGISEREPARGLGDGLATDPADRNGSGIRVRDPGSLNESRANSAAL